MCRKQDADPENILIQRAGEDSAIFFCDRLDALHAETVPLSIPLAGDRQTLPHFRRSGAVIFDAEEDLIRNRAVLHVDDPLALILDLLLRFHSIFQKIAEE